MYEHLRSQFIQADRPYVEGVVDVFLQHIPVGEVRKGRLCITALGVYEAELSGEKVGDILFAPGYTYYPHLLQVQTYDVTGMLQAGDHDHTLRVYLGQGWYCGRYTFDNKCQIYGEHSAVAWVLTAETAEGILRFPRTESGDGGEGGSHKIQRQTSGCTGGRDSVYEGAGRNSGEISRLPGRRDHS